MGINVVGQIKFHHFKASTSIPSVWNSRHEKETFRHHPDFINTMWEIWCLRVASFGQSKDGIYMRGERILLYVMALIYW